MFLVTANAASFHSLGQRAFGRPTESGDSEKKHADMLRGSEMHLSGLVVSTAEGECQRITKL